MRLLTLACMFLSAVQLSAADKLHEVTTDRNLTYGKGGNTELKLDLARPSDGGGPYPAIVCIHGGAWRFGSRSVINTRYPSLNGRSAIEYLAAHGFVAATISYRLIPKTDFDGQLADCKAAVRWMRANAAKYGIDPNRIAVCGYSAGGHYACLLGLTEKSDGFEGNGGNADQSSRVQAVVDLFGPTDLTKMGWNQDTEDGIAGPLIGARLKDRPDLFRRASPICYVRDGKKYPPFLIMHGTEDKVVPINQSQLLMEKLKESGVKYKYVEMPGVRHGWFALKLPGALDEIVAFLNEQLKP